jgi:hypothetical protein
MEACDLVGGEACEAAEMYPETKLGGSSAVDVAGSRVREEAVADRDQQQRTGQLVTKTMNHWRRTLIGICLLFFILTWLILLRQLSFNQGQRQWFRFRNFSCCSISFSFVE